MSAEAAGGPLVWVDVETTGLDADDLFLELAVIVTDADLGERGVYHRLVDQASAHVDACLAASPEVCHMHATSGLTRALAAADGAAASPGRIDAEVCAFLDDLGVNRAPLAGSSVGFDRAVLNRWLPAFADRLSYRTVDVSSVKELARRWWPLTALLAGPAGDKAHRALADLRSSIAELAAYRARLEEGATR